MLAAAILYSDPSLELLIFSGSLAECPSPPLSRIIWIFILLVNSGVSAYSCTPNKLILETDVELHHSNSILDCLIRIAKGEDTELSWNITPFQCTFVPISPLLFIRCECGLQASRPLNSMPTIFIFQFFP